MTRKMVLSSFFTFLLLLIFIVSFAGRDVSADASVVEDRNNLDLAIIQKLRHSLATDNNLSATAQGVSILALGGEVTLRGLVNTPDEEKAIVNSANSIAGVNKVIDQLEVRDSINL